MKLFFQNLFDSFQDSQRPFLFSYANAALFIFISLCVFVAVLPATSIREICFYSAVALTIGLLISGKNNFSFKTPLTIPFLLFLLWAVLDLIWALNLANSIHDVYAHLIRYLVIFFIVVNVFQSRRRLMFLIWLFVISASVLSYGGIIYFYFIQGNDWLVRFTNPLYIPYLDFVYVPASIFIVFLLFQTSDRLGKGFLLFCLLGTCAAMLLTQTRNAFVALAIALAILLYRQKKVLLIAAVICTLVLTFMFIKNERYSSRVITESGLIRNSILVLFVEMVKDQPITGIGFGMQTYASPELLNKYNQKIPVQYRQPHPYGSPHNTFMDITVRTGFLGLAIYCSILFKLVQMSWVMIRKSRDKFINSSALAVTGALVAFIFQGMFADTQFGVQAFVFYLLCSIMTILWLMNQQAIPAGETSVAEAQTGKRLDFPG